MTIAQDFLRSESMSVGAAVTAPAMVGFAKRQSHSDEMHPSHSRHPGGADDFGGYRLTRRRLPGLGRCNFPLRDARRPRRSFSTIAAVRASAGTNTKSRSPGRSARMKRVEGKLSIPKREA